MKALSTPALLTRIDLERVFGVNPRAVANLVAAGILPPPVRMGSGRTSKMIWRTVDVEDALLAPLKAGFADDHLMSKRP